MNYTSREVIRRLKQYDMFLESLKLTTDEVKKERIKDQLDKIEKQILLDTNSEYEEEYMLLLGKSSKLIDEERERLHSIISLITSRREYLENRKKKHKKITGSLVELTTFLGEDKLDDFNKKLEIIDKYEGNKIKQESLIKDIRVLDIKISESSRNVKANVRLNESLEKKMISLLEKAFSKHKLYGLVGEKEKIQSKFDSLKYARDMAKENLLMARETGSSDTILECDNMLSEINKDYEEYSQKINIIKLIGLYDKNVNGYDELLDKREKMNDILKEIADTDLYFDINEELSKQYNTIKLQVEDTATYERLKKERDKKNTLLFEIGEENGSSDFKLVLDELIKNERRFQEERIIKARREEYLERQKKLLEEQRIETSRVKRQKLIEEARLKDQLERTAKLKELQEKTVINTNKKEEPKNVFIKLEEPKKEDVRKDNPEEKLFDSIISTSNSFDTEELFENTKILPNKPGTLGDIFKEDNTSSDVSSVASEVFDDEQNPSQILSSENINIFTPTDNLNNQENTPESGQKEVLPSLETNEVVNVSSQNEIVPKSKENIMDLFKEKRNEREKLEIKDKDKEIDPDSSIYDLLENNDNIIWKSTESKNVDNKIPVIGNNNLVPEIVEKKEVNLDLSGTGEEGGEFLWKETM